MSGRGREPVATNEPAVVSEPLPNAVVVENIQSDGCFPGSFCTYESDRGEIFGETNNLLDQLVTSETGPRGWGR